MSGTEQHINKILCGDNVKILESFDPDSIDLTVTSPPYDDMDLDYNPIIKNGQRDYEGYDWNFKALVSQLYRVTKPGGIVTWVVNDPTVDGSESLASSLQRIYFRLEGFSILDTMIYKKSGASHPANNKYHQVFEYMFVLCKGKNPKVFHPLMDRENRWHGTKWGKFRTRRLKDGSLKKEVHKDIAQFGMRFNVWEYAVGHGNHSTDDFAHEHPASFPEDLAQDHIESWTNPGDIVLDPFAGSGTTLKMAMQAGRRYIGIDVARKYIDLAQRRLNAANPPLFIMSNE